MDSSAFRVARRSVPIAAALVVLALFVTNAFSTSSSQAQVVEPDGPVYTIQNVATGRYLDADGRTQIDTSVRVRDDDLWYQIPADDDTVLLQNALFGSYLDIDPKRMEVNQSKIASADDQWVLEPTEEDNIFFVRSNIADLYLETSGPEVQPATFNGQARQQWRFQEKIAPPPTPTSLPTQSTTPTPTATTQPIDPPPIPPSPTPTATTQPIDPAPIPPSPTPTATTQPIDPPPIPPSPTPTATTQPIDPPPIPPSPTPIPPTPTPIPPTPVPPSPTPIPPTPTPTLIPTPTPVPPTPTPIPPTPVPPTPTPVPPPTNVGNPCPAYVNSDIYRSRTNQITVTPDENWEAVLTSAKPDTEILLVDGEYRITRDGIWMPQGNLTIRSASGNRDAVVIIGKGNRTRGEGLMLAGPDMTIADLTIRNTRDHGISIHPLVGASASHMYNLNMLDIGTQFIKANSGAEDPNGIVACSSMGYSSVDVVEGDYFAAVDVHQGVDWVIRDNYIYNMVGEGNGCEVDIDCGTYFSHPAILVWNNSRGTIIERNIMIENTRSITLGLGNGHSGGIVRNNFIYQLTPGNSGIELWDAEDVLVEHNTVITNGYRGAIDYSGAPNIVVRNNLLNFELLDRSDSPRGPSPGGTFEGNIFTASAADFVTLGEVRLRAGSQAIGAGVPVPGAEIGDIDSQPRNGRFDVGADHYTG